MMFFALGFGFGLVASFPICVSFPAWVTHTNRQDWLDWWDKDPTGGVIVGCVQLLFALTGGCATYLLLK